MIRSLVIGLGLAGVAIWAGKRAGLDLRKELGLGGSAGGSSGNGMGSAASAHTPDGSDASRSFAAGIADENTIPDAAPAI